MNFFWLYDLPSFWLILVVTLFFVFIGVGGFLITEPFIKRWIGSAPESNRLVSNFISLIGVFYGITLGLIAVAAWGGYCAASETLSKEALYICNMYKIANLFPEPTKSQLKKELKETTRYIIEDAWPIQQQGLIPKGGNTEKIESILYRFDPKTENDKIVFSEEIDQLKMMLDAKREREGNITFGLPAVIYCVMFIGAFINISMTWFFVGTKKSLHVLLTTLACVLIGSLISIVVAMDYPYCGKFGIAPKAYQTIYNDVMSK